jgi:glutaredoxin
MTQARRAIALLLAISLAGPAAAQQIYRWTDSKGRVHITDTPPPSTARDVKAESGGAPSAAGQDDSQVPFEVTRAMKAFPVVLYTSPPCQAPCAHARELLNRRGVPFKEVQVWDSSSIAELKRVSGSDQVPVLLVGRSVQQGFDQGAYDALLDSARYPEAGSVPARKQAPPPPPEGYAAAGKHDLKAEPVKPEEQAKPPRGPYSPAPPPETSGK